MDTINPDFPFFSEETKTSLSKSIATLRTFCGLLIFTMAIIIIQFLIQQTEPDTKPATIAFLKMITSGTMVISLIAWWVFQYVAVFRIHTYFQRIHQKYPISAWGAVARIAIPLYKIWGIWNLFSTMGNYFVGGSGKIHSAGKAVKTLIPFLYLFWFVSYFAGIIFSRAEQLNKPAFELHLFFLASQLLVLLAWLLMFLYIKHALSETYRIFNPETEILQTADTQNTINE
jgi:hypothetical protein